MPTKRVPWLKFWPELVDHEKFAELTDNEAWTWVKLLARAGQQPTRGRFASVNHAAIVTGRPTKHIERLIEVCLIDKRDDGLWMHDWHIWQRWRPSDEHANDDETSPDEPSNDAGSTHDQHTISRPKKEEGRREKEEGREETGTSSDEDVVGPGSDAVDRVWTAYRECIQPAARLCPRKKIAARLKTFGEAAVLDGIDRFARSPWWMEHNGRRGGAWFFDSDPDFERFILLDPESEKRRADERAAGVVPFRPAAPPGSRVSQQDRDDLRGAG